MNQAENITDLSNKTAVVIGGTSGLGRAIALGLARSGANVIAARTTRGVSRRSFGLKSKGWAQNFTANR